MVDKLLPAAADAAQAEERRRPFVLTAQRFDEFPNLWTAGPNFDEPHEGQRRQSAAGRVHLGPVRAHRVPQRRRQDPARHPDQARGLRPVEEVPADGLHLRGADRRAAPLRRARARARASTSPATSATATSSCSPTSSTRSAIPGESALKCVLPAVQKVVEHGLHRPGADRHPGPQLGRLPDHLPDHPDRHLRRRRGRAPRSPT